MEELLLFRILLEHWERSLYEDAENFPFSANFFSRNLNFHFTFFFSSSVVVA